VRSRAKSVAGLPTCSIRHIAIERADELCWIKPALLGIGPSGKNSPARATGGLEGLGDDLYAVDDKVVPVFDALRVPVTRKKEDGGRLGRGILRQARVPVRREEAPALGNRINVSRKRHCDHCGLEPVDHGACLCVCATSAA